VVSAVVDLGREERHVAALDAEPAAYAPVRSPRSRPAVHRAAAPQAPSPLLLLTSRSRSSTLVAEAARDGGGTYTA